MTYLADERGQDHELAALADQARRGSAAAFDALARRVRERVRRWAEGITHDSDDADDVAQLVLLKLHARIEQFEGRSRLTTWLYQVTRNLAFNRVARDRRRSGLLAREQADIVEAMQQARTARRDEAVHFAHLVHHFLDDLPERQRAAFELGDLQGLTSTQIAERLDISASTARGLLMKARRRIRLKILQAHPHLLEEYTP